MSVVAEPVAGIVEKAVMVLEANRELEHHSILGRRDYVVGGMTVVKRYEEQEAVPDFVRGDARTAASRQF